MSARPLRLRLGSWLHAYRQLGPLRGTVAAWRYARRLARGRVRELLLSRRAISVSPADVAAALGGRDTRSALLSAADALPSVGRWVAELGVLEPAVKDRLLAAADRVLAHEFDLLGSDPTELGSTIDWHRDFKSGRRWPLDHISRIVVSYPDDSDIKVPWELSRCQHLPLLALAYRLTTDQRYVEEIGTQISAWIDANPVEFGVNWQCTMDVAIRAVNWVAALTLCAPDPAIQPWLDQATTTLLMHARFIRNNLEYGAARGNHYLSDVVGLLVTASVFQTSEEGQRWIRWAVNQLDIERAHQIRSDGCDHEASTSYHRLVAELFIIGADAADALAPGMLKPSVRTAIDRMLQFVSDYTRPDGLAPQLGDADDGRLLPLGDYGTADQRSHLHLFRQAGKIYRPARASSAYPEGGFYILRGGDLYAAVRCGDVGIHGRGCHAHNDLLAFELCWRSTPLVVDPGSYVYTADPDDRNHFRSTGAHSTLQVDEREQNEIRADRLFAMANRARPEVLGWEPGETTTTLKGRHRGFTIPGDRCLHTRTLGLDGAGAVLEVIDELCSEQTHELTWRFPLAACEVEAGDGIANARFGDVTLQIKGDGLAFDVEDDWLAPSYGVRARAPVMTLRTKSEPGEHRTVISLRVIAD